MEAWLKVGALLFLLHLINSVATREVPLSLKSELLALYRLRGSLGLRARHWPRKTDPCKNWTGVNCQNGRVIGINLSGLRRTRLGLRNPQFSLDPLVNLTLLASFNSSGFSLRGSIPDWFGSRFPALQVLDLRSCSIIGSIPPSFGSLNMLRYLYLSNNSLTGIIPSTLGQLSALSVVDLSRNSLSGSIPSALSALSNLTSLNLSSNYLSDSIPSGLSLISSLQFLNLYDNTLSGSIPAQLGKLSQLVKLNLGLNYLSGPLPGSLGSLRSLKEMLIGNNDLEGTLPDALWSLTQLHILDVSGNNFTGALPNFTAAFVASVGVVNLSNNLFYGNLTVAVTKFHLIDLSDNYFQGLSPNNTGSSNATISRNCLEGVLLQKSFDNCRRFYADRGLASDTEGAPDPMQPPVAEHPRNKRKLTYIMVGVFGGFGLVILFVLVLVLLLRRTWQKGNSNARGSANIEPVSVGNTEIPPKFPINLSGLGESFEYEKMVQATDNFSETNLIKHGHSGDLFRGTLEGGFAVVIKRVDLRSFNRELYMLELELDLFRQVKHPRLVPLLGHSLVNENENEKLLVYKYMPNRDLSSSLHKLTNLEDDGLQSLDWITRLKIAIGAAECLSYLHHDCDPSLVHRDIQASSILLDDKYEVRLGSLSEVCSQEGDTNQNGITRLLRMAETSEAGMTGSTCTCSYDVYCFGKVLLELVTGKLGIDKSDNASTTEWLEQTLPFISISKRELVINIIDQTLVIDEDLLEEVWAVAIVAKSCLNPKPSRRPLMRHILRALENPFKVVRDESFCSSRLRITSSRRSWNAALFGSWRIGSSERTNFPGQVNREFSSGQKHSDSQTSGTNDHSSSHKRQSSEIFPEPMEMQDIERQEQDGN